MLSDMMNKARVKQDLHLHDNSFQHKCHKNVLTGLGDDTQDNVHQFSYELFPNSRVVVIGT